MIHPDTILRRVDDSVGFGVFATRTIPRGTITWALDPLDQLLDDEHVADAHRAMVDKYTYRTATGQRLLAWDLCRYMNHSCEANTFGTSLNLEIAVVDIQPGDQLTSDYAALNLEPEESFDCLCGARRCRRWVADAQFEMLAESWDTRIRDAFERIPIVEQPLSSLLSDYPGVLAAALNPSLVPSILATRYLGPASADRRRKAG